MFVSSVVNRVKHARHLFATDSLFRNATYLTASTVVMSLLGFLFWIFIAHVYSPAQIGVASALIAITTLISNLSLLGLNSGMIRFLPHAKDQSRDINAATIVVGSVTLLAAAAYAFIGAHVIGHIGLLAGTGGKVAFTVLMVTVSLNSLTDAVFIANRRGEYHTAGYTTLGLVKLVLPLFLVPFGSAGIFGAYILAMLASLLLSYYLMWRGCGYRFFARPNWEVITQTRTYAAHNYIGALLSGLPAQLMPIFIIRSIGESSVAFFSMAWTMSNLLYVIPSAAMQSLLAEASHNPDKKNEHIARTLRLLTLILVPAVALSIVVAPFMLKIFGTQYQRNATTIFQLFAFSTFFIAINSAGNTVLNIERKTWGIVSTQVINLVVTFGSALWLFRYGLPGIGTSVVLGNFAASVAFLVIFWRLRHAEKARRRAEPTHPFFGTRQAVARLLHAYGITEFTYRKFTNGSSNTTLLIDHSGGRAALRVYQAPSINDRKIAEEIDFMEYLAAHGVPVPRVIPNSRGGKLSKTTIDGVDRYYILMEYVPGHHPAAYSLPVLTEMAAHQAQIHLGGQRYVDSLQDLKIKKTLLAKALPHGLSHFDFDASNILVSGNRVSSILDFEGMRYGPLVACMYFTLKDIYELDHDIALPIAYLSLYQKTRKLHMLEKGILAALLSLRYRNVRFLRTLVV